MSMPVIRTCLCSALFVASACSLQAAPLDKISQISSKDQIMTTPMPVSNTRECVSFSDAQKDYLSKVMVSMFRVLSGENSLDNEEKLKLFGDGLYHWPKNGDLPTLRYYENQPDRDISVSFERQKNGDAWIKAELGLIPSGFPITLFRMNLSEKFFSGLVLERIYAEERVDEPINKVVFFVFRTEGRPHDLRLEFKTRENMVDIKKDKYPRSFFLLTIKRI